MTAAGLLKRAEKLAGIRVSLVTVGASYNGRFNANLTDHGVMGKVMYKF